MTPLLLSKRQAAKLLGVGRDTLTSLIASGHIHTVELLGQVKVPREEIERFAREGTAPLPVERVRAPRRQRKSGDGIRALVIT